MRTICLPFALFCALALPAWGFSAEPLHVQTINLLGNRKTKKSVVLNELTFREGDTLLQHRLEEVLERNRQNVYNLGLFNEVQVDHEELNGNLYIIIEVKERWYVFPRPHIRVEERNTYDLITAVAEGDFSRLAYGASVRWRNVGGYNETLRFYGQLGFSKRLYLDFLRPGLFGNGRVDFVTGLHHIHEKEIMYGTERAAVRWGRVESEPTQRSYNMYVGLRKRFSVYNSLYGELSYKHYRFSDSIYTFLLNGEQANFIPNDRPLEQYPSLILSYACDLRDVKAYPLKGYKYQVFGRLAGVPGASSVQFAKLGFTWAHHLPLNERWNIAYGTHHIYTFGRDVPFFEKSTIGIRRREFPNISTTLRGYQPYAIDGSYVMMTKSELKFALLPRKIYHMDEIPFKRFQDFPLGIYLTSFFELGYVSDHTSSNQDRFLRDTWLRGYGAGINIIGIYDILLRIEYARNHLGDGGIFLHGSVPIK